MPGMNEPSPLVEAFLSLREMFQAAVEAGFSQYQACIMLGAFLAASGQGGTERNE